MKGFSAVAAAIAISLALTTVSRSFGAEQQLSSAATETGIAACYSKRLRGHRTFSGQRYNPRALTAAHATIPMGTRVQLTNIENGRTTIVTVNDRLSANAGHGLSMDISQRACRQLKFPRTGEAKVKIDVLGSSSGSAKAQ
jgi:rare lipoprotein A